MFLKIDPDIELYYELKGQGEPLLLIHGVGVDADLYADASKILAKKYSVITYDRRGSSRSRIIGASTASDPNSAQKNVSYDVDAQINDIKCLLDALNIKEVFICGVSAGAILGFHFMVHYPDRVRKLVMYEPPLISLLDDREDFQRWVADMKDWISRRKLNKALFEFVQSINGIDERAPQKPADVARREMENMYHALKDEFNVFIDYQPDLNAAGKLSDRICVAVGEKSDGGPYPIAAKRFANLAGIRLLHFPGYHNLPSELPYDFAVCVSGALDLL